MSELSEKLLPCPCCGAEAHFGEVPVSLSETEAQSENAGGEYIECSKCSLCTALMFPLKGDVKRQLVERWNLRALSQPPDGESLRELCVKLLRKYPLDEAKEIVRQIQAHDTKPDSKAYRDPQCLTALEEKGLRQIQAERAPDSEAVRLREAWIHAYTSLGADRATAEKMVNTEVSAHLARQPAAQSTPLEETLKAMGIALDPVLMGGYSHHRTRLIAAWEVATKQPAAQSEGQWVRTDELSRLRDIEHYAWHVLEGSEERVSENELVLSHHPGSDQDLNKLIELLGEEHPAMLRASSPTEGESK